MGNNGDEGETVPTWEYPSVEVSSDPTEKFAKYKTRDQLRSDSSIEGPAIITEQDATTYIPTDWKAHVTSNGYLRIKKEGQA